MIISDVAITNFPSDTLEIDRIWQTSEIVMLRIDNDGHIALFGSGSENGNRHLFFSNYSMCIALLSIYQRHPYNCGFETDMIYYSRSLICTLNVRNSDEISASIKPCPFWYCVHFGWDTSFRLRKFLNIAQTFSGHVFNKNTSMMQPFITLERQFIIPPTTLFLACENWH